jgi:hypothetical protein
MDSARLHSCIFGRTEICIISIEIFTEVVNSEREREIFLIAKQNTNNRISQLVNLVNK